MSEKLPQLIPGSAVKRTQPAHHPDQPALIKKEPVKIETNPDPNYILSILSQVSPRPWRIEAHDPNDIRVMVYDANGGLVFHFHPVPSHPEKRHLTIESMLSLLLLT